MRHTGLALMMMMTAMLSGCARVPAALAAAPVPRPLSTAAPAAAAIPDTEPDVTQKVAAVLAQLGQGGLPREQLTDKAQAALTPQLAQMAAALRACGTPPALELLSRTTKGEDRNYLYRAPCHGTALLVEIVFAKGSRINFLALRPER